MKALLALVVMLGVMSSGCIIHVSHYTDSDGSTVYVGQLYSEGNSYDTSAQVQGTFYDAAGNVITTKAGPICEGVDQQRVIPFKVVLPPGTPAIDHVSWSVVGAPANPYLATGLEADVANTFTAGSMTYVVGELRNTSANTYVDGYPCASWTDASGNVVRVTAGRVAGTRLGPGDARPFELSVDTPPAGSTISFYLDAGVTNVPGHIAPSAVDVPTSAIQHATQAIVPTGSTTFMIGMFEVANTSGTEFLPEPIATLRDSAGHLTAVNDGYSECSVPAAPGSFTFAAYGGVLPSGTTTPPTVTLQGFQHNDGPVYFPVPGGLSFHASGLAVTATGTLTNTTSATLNRALVCVGGYDAGGLVSGVGGARVTLPAGGLAAGATAPFTVTFNSMVPVVSVKAVAAGY